MRRFSEWPDAKRIFSLATAGGARIAQMPGEVGTLAPGAKADLAILNLKTPAFLPVGSVERNLVYSENGSSVETVIIDGRIVLKDKKIPAISEDDLYLEIKETAARLKLEHRLSTRRPRRSTPTSRRPISGATRTSRNSPRGSSKDEADVEDRPG